MVSFDSIKTSYGTISVGDIFKNDLHTMKVVCLEMEEHEGNNDYAHVYCIKILENGFPIGAIQKRSIYNFCPYFTLYKKANK